MTIRNRIAGLLRGREVTVQELMEHPRIAEDNGFLPEERLDREREPVTSFNIDDKLRAIGQSSACLQMIGVPSMWSNDCRTSNPLVLPMADWKCEYCGCVRPHTEYKCGYCGAPRKKEGLKWLLLQI